LNTVFKKYSTQKNYTQLREVETNILFQLYFSMLCELKVISLASSFHFSSTKRVISLAPSFHFSSTKRVISLAPSFHFSSTKRVISLAPSFPQPESL
jgi:hypothetical protein